MTEERGDLFLHLEKHAHEIAGTTEKLESIFEMQRKLGDRIIKERNIEKTLDEWVIGLTIAMESEIDEIRREVNWKWWKNPKEIDMVALKEEIIDLWHFIVQLSIMVGLTPDDVYCVYVQKNAENHARQSGTSEKEGYAVVDDLSESERGAGGFGSSGVKSE